MFIEQDFVQKRRAKCYCGSFTNVSFIEITKHFGSLYLNILCAIGANNNFCGSVTNRKVSLLVIQLSDLEVEQPILMSTHDNPNNFVSECVQKLEC